MIENQILRAAVVLLESSIGRRKYGHVAIREGGVGHLAGFQQLIELQQKSGYRFKASFDRIISLLIASPISGGARYAWKEEIDACGVCYLVHVCTYYVLPVAAALGTKSNNRLAARSKGRAYS